MNTSVRERHVVETAEDMDGGLTERMPARQVDN